LPPILFDTNICDKRRYLLATSVRISLVTVVSSINKIDCHDLTEIMFKMEIKEIRTLVASK
jgi:hypothetical protein